MELEAFDERVDAFRTLQEITTVDFTVYLCGADEEVGIGDPCSLSGDGSNTNPIAFTRL